MNGNIFINEAFNSAIEKYITNKDVVDSKEFDSFLVIVIRALVLIYGELDIINPYKVNQVGGFNDNLKKFGFSDSSLENFKKEMLSYYQNENNYSALKPSFINIQKYLIDMIIMKKNHVLISDEELKNFKDLLYTKDTTNATRQKLYSSLTPDSDVIIRYLNSKLFEQKHNFSLTEYKDIALSKEAYQLAGYNIIEIMNMSDEDILNINNKVYHFFRIKENDTNKRKRLDIAVDYFKKYGNTITTGNGYVDMLLLASIVATGFMVAIIIAIKFVG